MMGTVSDAAFRRVQSYLQYGALALLVTLALAVLAATVLATLGQLPWLTLELRFGETVWPQAGPWVQGALALVLLGLCFFLPANGRILRLERSHRDFRINLQDVAHAYQLAHAADRAGTFTLPEQFDAMRQRMEHLRDHPELGHLEPEILELAAAMSHSARDLAQTYSDAKVTRAKAFLAQREEEVTALNERLRLARYTVDDLKRWLADVEAEEAVAKRQIERLESDLRDVLPALGYDFEDAQQQPNVVHMQPKQPPTKHP